MNCIFLVFIYHVRSVVVRIISETLKIHKSNIKLHYVLLYSLISALTTQIGAPLNEQPNCPVACVGLDSHPEEFFPQMKPTLWGGQKSDMVSDKLIKLNCRRNSPTLLSYVSVFSVCLTQTKSSNLLPSILYKETPPMSK